MTQIPGNQHVTYQLQYRKCGKEACNTCKSGQGHGPYWYAYWREGTRLKSGYIGKKRINQMGEISDLPAATRKTRRMTIATTS